MNKEDEYVQLDNAFHARRLQKEAEKKQRAEVQLALQQMKADNNPSQAARNAQVNAMMAAQTSAGSVPGVFVDPFAAALGHSS